MASPLARAVKAKDPDLVHELIKAGADPNFGEDGGSTALVWACDGSDLELVALLLDKRADPNQRGTGGWTPLVRALSGSWEECAALLLDVQADPALCNSGRAGALSPFAAAQAAPHLSMALRSRLAAASADALEPLQLSR
eukprot:CAMPEP_0185183128 /NCGR_PEP_ID=MMETSP1140-20130426/1773_1 /TAXON_ID=298111 /ORGANISM="Pavlova sp., Strain CCMP459" /LENGTH=139 /DNA_ID=CAMNT_0027749115 /DNA_START=67 /DNA_END=482 /DNA_ORIENTATION=+